MGTHQENVRLALELAQKAMKCAEEQNKSQQLNGFFHSDFLCVFCMLYLTLSFFYLQRRDFMLPIFYDFVFIFLVNVLKLNRGKRLNSMDLLERAH